MLPPSSGTIHAAITPPVGRLKLLPAVPFAYGPRENAHPPATTTWLPTVARMRLGSPTRPARVSDPAQRASCIPQRSVPLEASNSKTYIAPLRGPRNEGGP